ncbi:MAG: DUF5916 domain-containing protein [Acidobacteriota bacterium]
MKGRSQLWRHHRGVRLDPRGGFTPSPVRLFDRTAIAGILALSVLAGADVLGFGADIPPLVLPRINGPVTLDGVSDEAAWSGVEPLPVVMLMPNSGAAPSERTEVLVAHDDAFIYVAGRLFDSEPSRIQANSKERDSPDGSSEWFGVVIDSFNDKSNALAFFTTPAGLRWDCAVLNDAEPPTRQNVSWNAFWDVAAARNGYGWFAEMRIPLSSLRFQDVNGRVTMGLIAWRKIARKEEFDSFPTIPPKWGFWGLFKPSQARECVLEGVYSRKPLFLTPYALGGAGHSTGSVPAGEERVRTTQREAGLDLKYGLTSNLTLDVAVNPDFAQVEADDQQINLTRFSLFFPEKRLFFQERSGTFDFNFESSDGTRLFYSRRIGTHDGELVRIYGGARLVGRVGQWDVGMLNMQTAALDDVPSENFGVYRLRRQAFNPYSYVGGIVTTRLGRRGDYNLAYGLDSSVRLFGDDYLTAKWAQTFEDGARNSPLSFDPARLRVVWERRTSRGFSYYGAYSRAGPDYEPDLGFEARKDFSLVRSQAAYGWVPGEPSRLYSHQLSLIGSVYLRNQDGSVESAEVSPQWSAKTRSGYELYLFPSFAQDDVREPFEIAESVVVPVGRYQYASAGVEMWTPDGKLLSTGLNLDAGGFYDGWRVAARVRPRWSLSADLQLQGDYLLNRIVFPDRGQELTAHLAKVRALYMMSTKLSAAAFVQYNSTTNAVIANARLRYNPREGVDLYLVYNDVLNTNRPAAGLPRSDSRAVLLKYTYTFSL